MSNARAARRRAAREAAKRRRFTPTEAASMHAMMVSLNDVAHKHGTAILGVMDGDLAERDARMIGDGKYPGGCDHCDAYMTVQLDRPLPQANIHHDDGCRMVDAPCEFVELQP